MQNAKFSSLIIPLVLFLFFSNNCSSLQTTQEVITEGTYIMGEGETLKLAEFQAMQDAKEAAIRKFGIYINQYKKVVNYELEQDEIYAITAGLLQIEILEQTKEPLGKTIMYKIKIKAIFHPEKLEELSKKIDQKKKLESAVFKKNLKLKYIESIIKIKKLHKELKQIEKKSLATIEKQIEKEEKLLESKKWLEKAYSFSFFNDYQSAFLAYEKAIQLDPQNYWAIHDRGTTLSKIGNHMQALSDFNQALSGLVKVKSQDLDILYINRGELYIELGKLTKALNDCSQAILINPNNSDAYICRGNIYKKLKNKLALFDFKRAVELAPKSKRVYFNRLLFYLETSDIDSAKNELKILYDLFPQDIAVLKSRCLFDDVMGNDPNENTKICSKAIELDPKNDSLYLQRGNAYYKNKDYKKALADYNQTILINPKNGFAYRNRFKVKRALNINTKDSYDDLQNARKIEVNSSSIAFELGSLLLFEFKNYFLAYKELTNAILLAKKNLKELDGNKIRIQNIYFHRSLCLFYLGLYKDTIADLDIAIKLDPSSPEYYYRRGVSYLNLSEVNSSFIDKGLADLNKSIQLNPNNPNAFYDRGGLYEKFNRDNEAIEDYTNAIRLNPEYYEAYSKRGFSYAKIDKFEEALQDYSLVIRNKPSDPLNFYLRGLALHQQKKIQDAILDYTSAIELNSEYFDAFLKRCSAYFIANNLKNALNDCNSAIRIHPKSYHALMIRSEIFMKQNYFDEAIVDLNEAVKIEPKIEKPYFKLGLCYHSIDKNDTALKHFNKALSINPDNYYSHYFKARIYLMAKNLKLLENSFKIVCRENQNLCKDLYQDAKKVFR